MKGQSKTSEIPLIQPSATPLTDQEDDESDQKRQSQNVNTAHNAASNHYPWSSVNEWIKMYKLEHLEQHLIKHDLFSFDKLKQLALSNDWKQTTAMILNEHRITHVNYDHKPLASDNRLQSNFENGLNALLINTLGKTDDFLSKLKQLCKEKTKNDDKDWVLMLIDCDDIGLLLHDEKISIEQAQNSINLLNANICRINKDDKIFGYHLGSDLFALFVYDKRNKMKKSVGIAQYLLNVMRNKDKSSFTISIGLGLRFFKSTSDKNGSVVVENDFVYDDELIQREWVLNAHINLLRAKENGKNCYFNIPNTIDSSKDNEKLATITAQAQKSYLLYLTEADNIVDRALDTFDEDTLVKQTVTTKNKECIDSICFLKATIIFYEKTCIGNFKYRSYAASKWIKLAMKTFIIGNMSIECYYYYKMVQEEIKMGLDDQIFRTNSDISKQDKERIDDTSNFITQKYDLTTLTRKRSADAVVTPVMKHTALYCSKNAFEHLHDTSEAPLICCAVGYDVSEIGKRAFEYGKQIYEEVLKFEPNFGMAACNLLLILWDMEQYDEYLDYAERFVKTLPAHIYLLWRAANGYRDSCASLIDKQIEKSQLSTAKDERINKAIQYGQQMIDVANSDKQWVTSVMYLFYGSLLYLWSKDFDKNEKQQRLALKMYEKGIKLDQQLGFDIINNWTRDFDKFELT